jgi:fluoroquinolone transport system ATP-binding protein
MSAVIDVEHLTFAYEGADQPAVRDLSFSIDRGSIFGFLGPSGSGKSTTQKILIGLLRDYMGAVRVLDRDVADWRSDDYERIGVSFELPNHFLKLTALENLNYFAALYRGDTIEPIELLSNVGLEEDGDMLVSQFSKGMKNRLSVAKALLNNPELLFLDEPTAGLDPVNGRRIKNLIKEQRDADRTVFLTTHDMTVADELCDQVAFLVDGRIRLVDSPRSLKLSHGQRLLRVEYRSNGADALREFPLDDLADNAEFQDLLRTSDIQTMHTQESTLERIFIDVTGRALS